MMAIAQPPSLFDEITDFLASGPTAEAIIAYKPSEFLDQRLHELLHKNSNDQLTAEERVELDSFLQINHLLTVVTAKARLKLAGKR
ncbi:MAG: hypothetical protein ABI690_29700 [Chloroflexota bacterium]